MIIEGLLTTTDAQGSPHVAPMGPLVDPELGQWTLRPFVSSTTYQLLRANPHCVFHVVDDVVPVVESALGLSSSLNFESHVWSAVEVLPDLGPDSLHNSDDDVGRLVESRSRVWTIPSACHWYHLRVNQWDVTQERSCATAQVLEQRVLRPFWGWNRAKHAVLEATILATRLHLADRRQIDEDLTRLKTAVIKTAGPRELQAWEMLQNYFETH